MAVHPKHLSLWERYRGVGKHYNADLDYKQKIEDMRADWEMSQARKVAEKEGHLDDDVDVDDSVWSSDVSTYFERTAGTPLMRPKEKYPPGDESESPER